MQFQFGNILDCLAIFSGWLRDVVGLKINMVRIKF